MDLALRYAPFFDSSDSFVFLLHFQERPGDDLASESRKEKANQSIKERYDNDPLLLWIWTVIRLRRLMKTITVIHCWSAPRSRSTALLYSFEARGDDCVAIDEPLYREWLVSKGDEVERPYFRELVEGVPPDDSPDQADQWKRELQSLDERITASAQKLKSGGVVFCKHMAKHSFLYDFDRECKVENTNVIHRHLLLIRDPVAVLSSWGVSGEVHGNSATSDELGIVPLLSIFSKVESSSKGHRYPAILESDDLVADPENALSTICCDLSIPYKESMISWNSGPHECDGPWAKWWYANVHKSAGWQRKTSKQYFPETRKYRTLNPILMPALRASLPAYEFLRKLTHTYRRRGPPPNEIYEDPRNEHLLVWIGSPERGRLLPRDLAGVSPWDSSVQEGDACWEEIQVIRGKILSFDKYMGRLFRSARALGFANVHTRDEVEGAVFRTLAANGMRDNAFMRLILSRGEKCTSRMNPKFNVYGTTLIILPEWKPPEANLSGATDSIILDMDGFVCETNATKIFVVDDKGVLITRPGDRGITGGTVVALADELEIPCEFRHIASEEFHSAEEVFTTGPTGEITPVTTFDGRKVGSGERGKVTKRLQDAFKSLPERPGWATEIPQFSYV